MKYGLLDTIDNVWLDVNDEGTGPRTFEDHALARLVAEVLTDQMQWPIGRIKVEEYATESPRFKDEVDKKWHGTDNVLRFLRRKEEGHIP